MKVVDKLSISWRDHRATLTFATELLSQAAKFLFYLIFFAIVFTYYGMPINIFREVYMSYQNLRKRLSAFHSYRKLTYNMNERFESVTSEEELEELGRVCIICRDVMDINGGCKKLPGCGHAFHRHCLREWLVQQQTCPTCRGDIVANEARAKAEKKRKEEEEQQKKEEEIQQQPPPQEQEETKESGDTTTVSNTETAVEETKTSEKKKKMTMEKETPAFPCLYRVMAPSGAAVFDPDLFKNNSSVEGTTKAAAVSMASSSPNIARTVSYGKIIVCTDMKWFRGGGENEDGSEIMNEPKMEEEMKSISTATDAEKKTEEVKAAASGMMLEMPDGWVRESDLQRMLPFVLPDDDEEEDCMEKEDESFVEVEHDPKKAAAVAAK
uniref:RING-type E3 ubiquitin transferase n=1 Tax=Helicotheca tamesis TaxID=374047 RepID=A0A7S2GY65_9STRA